MFKSAEHILTKCLRPSVIITIYSGYNEKGDGVGISPTDLVGEGMGIQIDLCGGGEPCLRHECYHYIYKGKHSNIYRRH
jgi:hypothetical protein